MEKNIAVYPGSFDPITNGHVDVTRRALAIFDKVIIAVAKNPGKNPMFSIDERMEMIRKVLEVEERIDHERVELDTFEGLLVNYVDQRGVKVILRGMRAMSDFEYEFQLALMNRKLKREIETLFMMTGFKWFYTSSSIIKEAASLGGSVEGLVPPLVNEMLKDKYLLKNNK